MTLLEKAREATAAMWNYRGYYKDAECILAGQTDFSADVQCALIALLMEINPDASLPVIARQAEEIALETGSSKQRKTTDANSPTS